MHKELGPDYDVETHFTPNYNPWDQRLCAVPDGDMFTAIREGKADVVTDHIDHFNSSGIALKSGKHLEADIVIVATGLQLKFGGDIVYYIDGEEVDLTERFVYRGMMLSGVPNVAMSFGYTKFLVDAQNRSHCELRLRTPTEDGARWVSQGHRVTRRNE